MVCFRWTPFFKLLGRSNAVFRYIVEADLKAQSAPTSDPKRTQNYIFLASKATKDTDTLSNPKFKLKQKTNWATNPLQIDSMFAFVIAVCSLRGPPAAQDSPKKPQVAFWRSFWTHLGTMLWRCWLLFRTAQRMSTNSPKRSKT